MRDNRVNQKTIFFALPIKERRFYHEARIRISRKEARKHLEQFHLACEFAKVLWKFFPDLMPLLKDFPDSRHQSYITYPGVILFMTRILSSIFYISSMRKTSEEFNSVPLIENIWVLCGEEPSADKLPYWETINRYLEKLDPDGLHETVCRLCSCLIRSRVFENNRIRGRYWQVIIDGTQLYSTREELDGKCLYRIHKRGKPEEYRENYYYIVEAKLVLHPEIVVSVMTEFLGSEGGEESGKQDCERNGCRCLMERLKKAFPHLKICVYADSLYVYEGFFRECGEKYWRYIVRFKEGSIPSVAEEYYSLKKREKNCRKKKVKEDIYWYDCVSGIDYNGYLINVVEYREEREREYHKGKGWHFLIQLPKVQHLHPGRRRSFRDKK